MSFANPLTAAIERDRVHRYKARKDRVELRGIAALHESAHAVVGFRYVPHGHIEVPFDNPHGAFAYNLCSEPDHAAEVSFAGCAIDAIIFGHGLFASHDYAKGKTRLVREYGHGVAEAKARALRDQVYRYVVANLPGIQAMAVAVMRNGVLPSRAFNAAARKAGFLSWGASGTQQADVDTYLEQFAQTPEELRDDLGFEIIGRAHEARLSKFPTTIEYECPCGGCETKINDTAIYREALIKLQRALYRRAGFNESSLVALHSPT